MRKAALSLTKESYVESVKGLTTLPDAAPTSRTSSRRSEADAGMAVVAQPATNLASLTNGWLCTPPISLRRPTASSWP